MSIVAIILDFIDGPKRHRERIAGFRPLLLGRGEDADLQLPETDLSVSRRQAYLELSPNECVLTIVAGANPVVQRNRTPVAHRCVLKNGDEIRFGQTLLRISFEAQNSECMICNRRVDRGPAEEAEDHPDLSIYAHEPCADSIRSSDLTFGCHEVLEVVGDGGAGRVYQVYERRTRRVWALKYRTNPGQSRRFDREMYELQAMQHANVIGFVRGCIEQTGTPYFVMEYARHGTLASFAERIPVQDRTQTVLRLMDDVLEGLQYLHGPGKVHRDVKPDNILVQSEMGQLPGTGYRAKLSDFGLVKGANNVDLTGDVPMVCGSMPFIAPEQIGGLHSVDARADIYAAGVSLYYLLSGRLPFQYNADASDADTSDEIRHGIRTSLHKIRPDLPDALCKAVDKACSPETRQRFVSAARFQEALRETL